MTADSKKSVRGVAHHPSLEQMLRFRSISADDKLRWLDQLRQFVAGSLPPERRDIFHRFRRGEL